MTSDQELDIAIRLLGTFEVGRQDRLIRADDWPRKKASALLKRLAMERRMLKDQAIEFLWPESDPVSAANNLYKTLYVLRQVLDTALGAGASESTFRFEDGVLSLLPSVWVDALEFEQLCTARLNIPSDQRAARIVQALDLYRGDLLPDDRFTEWTLIPRERLYRCQREARLELAIYHRDAQGYTSAITLLLPLLEHDRADELVHRELMRLYALSGLRHEALRQYQACLEALAAEIDAPPAPETVTVYKQILNGELAPSPPMGKALKSSPMVPFEEKPRPLFVSREPELSTLNSHLKAAIARDSRIVFITGEAGLGKTSLMAEFAYRSLAEFPELVIAAGACQDLLGIADPYLPFRDLIAMLSGDWQRPWLGGEISAALAQRLLAIAPYTSQLIGDHAPDLVGVLVPAPEPRHDAQTRSLNNQLQIFDQMSQFLRALATQQPLILLLDDLQWIDTASANLLFYLSRQLANSRVLIVGAYRPSEVDRRDSGEHPLAPVVQELVGDRGEIQINLDTSIPADERNFIDALVDSEPNQLDATFREALYRRTKGHPLFTTEMLRALQDQGDLKKNEAGMWAVSADLDWGILPARVEAVIARRIEILPQEVRDLLKVASVDGESFSVEVVAQVGGIAVRALLHELSQELDRRYRLVREQGDWRLGHQLFSRYQFRHNLFQQYLYHQLSSAERKTLHGEIAAALEQIGGQDLQALAVSLAHHYMAAGDTLKAVPYLCRAGDDARQRVALDDAVQFYKSALDYWQENNTTTREVVLHKLGDTLLALGRSMEAIDCFSKADRLYEQVGNRTGMGAMQRLIGRSYWEQGERTKALHHTHKALALLENEPPNAELARAVSAISQMHMLADEYDEAIAWGERALLLAQTLHTQDVILHALTSIGASLVAKGEVERGLAMIAESLEQAEALGLPHDAGRAYTSWGDSLVSLERYDEAQAIYERMLAYTQKVHTGMFEGVALVHLGYLDWWKGHWRQAWARRQEIMDWMAANPGSSLVKVWASNLLGWIYNDLGLPEKARIMLSEYTAVARSAHEPQTTVPHLAQLVRCAQSETQMAEFIQEIVSSTETTTYPRYEILPALRQVCSWLVQTTRGDPAALLRLEKTHKQMQNRQSAASLDEVRAKAAGLQGDLEQAVSNYESAAAHWEALNRPYDLLRTLAGLTNVLLSIQNIGSQAKNSKALRDVRTKTGFIIEQLANELDEPAVKQAFLASDMVMEIQRDWQNGL